MDFTAIGIRFFGVTNWEGGHWRNLTNCKQVYKNYLLYKACIFGNSML